MNEKNDGGPAFPMAFTALAVGDNTSLSVPCPSDIPRGMSLRDWFAGQTLPMILDAVCPENNSAQEIASACYEIADAMLAERTLKE